MNTFLNRRTSMVVILAMILSLVTACATKGNGMAQGDDDCSAAKSAGAGAILGGLLGSALGGKNGALKGAAAGALVGGLGCMVMNYHSKQVRTAKQVNKEYIEENAKLPPEPTVTDYSLTAPKQAVRGNPVEVNSSITVVDGSAKPVDSVEEKLYIINDNGERKQIKTKEAQGMSTGGEYSNSFSFTPPNGVAEGNYHLESEVYVNDQLAKTAKAPITLARDERGNLTLAFAQ